MGHSKKFYRKKQRKNKKASKSRKKRRRAEKKNKAAAAAAAASISEKNKDSDSHDLETVAAFRVSIADTYTNTKWKGPHVLNCMQTSPLLFLFLFIFSFVFAIFDHQLNFNPVILSTKLLVTLKTGLASGFPPVAGFSSPIQRRLPEPMILKLRHVCKSATCLNFQFCFDLYLQFYIITSCYFVLSVLNCK